MIMVMGLSLIHIFVTAPVVNGQHDVTQLCHVNIPSAGVIVAVVVD